VKRRAPLLPLFAHFLSQIAIRDTFKAFRPTFTIITTMKLFLSSILILAASAGRSNSSKQASSDDACSTVKLSIDFNAEPASFGYSLVCDDALLWDQPPDVSFTTPYDRFSDEICVDAFACCDFTIVDSANDIKNNQQDPIKFEIKLK